MVKDPLKQLKQTENACFKMSGVLSEEVAPHQPHPMNNRCLVAASALSEISVLLLELRQRLEGTYEDDGEGEL